MRKEKVRAELRDAVLRLCAVAGALLGMWWVATTIPDAPSDCTGMDCMARVLWPSVIKLGVAAVAGAMVGVLLCLTPPLRRR